MPNYQGDTTKLITSDYLYNNLKNLYNKIKSENSISEFETNKQYKVDNLFIYDKKLYRCIQEPIDLTQFVDTDWEEISKTDEVKLPFTTVDKTTIDFTDLPASDNYVLNGTLLDVQFTNTICSVVIDTDLLSIVTLDGKVYQFNTSTSTKILEDTFQIGQDVLDKIHDALYTTIPEIPAHYELSDSSTSGALVIVADGALSNPDTEIELSSVTPLLDGEMTIYMLLVNM